MTEILTLYSGNQERQALSRSFQALRSVKCIEELILGWVRGKRTMSLIALDPVALNSSEKRQKANTNSLSRVVEVKFLSNGRRMGTGIFKLDKIIESLPSCASIDDCLDSRGMPTEIWFENRNVELDIELDARFDINRCKPKGLSRLLLSYLINPGSLCHVRAFDALQGQDSLHFELMFVRDDNNTSASINSETNDGNCSAKFDCGAAGWKESCLVNRSALEHFVPHVYWV